MYEAFVWAVAKPDALYDLHRHKRGKRAPQGCGLEGFFPPLVRLGSEQPWRGSGDSTLFAS